MTTTVFHPATFQLLWLQSRGRRRRIWGRFCQRRRLALSAVACVLAVVWLGNAAMTVWLREMASLETLRALLSLGLVLYAGWHLAKAAFFRPESPFDWTPAEHELLVAMPLRPRDLVAYQLASVTATTILKAGLFTLLLLPDLRCVPLGLVGLLLAMMMLEMLRMTIDIVTWGMGRVGLSGLPRCGRGGVGGGRIRARRGDCTRRRVRRSDQSRRGTPATPIGDPGTIERFCIRLCGAAVSAIHRPDPGRRHDGNKSGAGRGRHWEPYWGWLPLSSVCTRQPLGVSPDEKRALLYKTRG